MGTARLELWQLGRTTQAQKNDGDAVEHLQQAELESRRGRSSGKQPDKMEKIEFASAVKQTCSFILSNSTGALVSNAVAETDNDISSERQSTKEEFQQFHGRILQPFLFFWNYLDT